MRSSEAAEPTYDFEVELAVRDYECDLEGVVNNAVYLNYLEHARHDCLHRYGFTFARLVEQGCHLVATHLEIDYKAPLRPGDRFVVRTGLRRHSRLRFAFDQEIRRLPDGQVMVQALVIGTGLVDGKPGMPAELLAAMEARPPCTSTR